MRDMVKYFTSRLGDPYCYATCARIITDAVAAAARLRAAQNGVGNPAEISPCGGRASFGKRGHDCIATFIAAALAQDERDGESKLHKAFTAMYGKTYGGFMDITASMALSAWGAQPLATLPATALPGRCIALLRPKHVGLYCGKGRTPHGKDIIETTPPCTLESRLPGNSSAKPFTHWAYVPEKWLSWSEMFYGAPEKHTTLPSSLQPGDKVRIAKTGVPYYHGGVSIPAWVEGKTFSVLKADMKNGVPCALLSEIMSWCAAENLKKV